MKVTIFSREDPIVYQWLIDFLGRFLRKEELTTMLITNNSRNDLRSTTFAIFYHSKTRGRLNFTDVTDSLYDEDLKEVSRALGERNVIVVMDDVEDNSQSQMTEILGKQHSIGRFARGLFLFTPGGSDTNHNNVSHKLRIKEIISEPYPKDVDLLLQSHHHLCCFFCFCCFVFVVQSKSFAVVKRQDDFNACVH